jgi:PIN domain nuclease of toxin-antitoxin system
MAEEYLLDASALLALLQNESGADRVVAVLDRASIHAVQLAEVVKKLNRPGIDPGFCEESVQRLALPVIEEFSSAQAYDTRVYCVKGMSLGDRICLSAANLLGMTIVSADRVWVTLAAGRPDWNVRISLIR